MDGAAPKSTQDPQETTVNAPASSAPSTTLTMLPLARLRVWPDNPRKTLPNLADLTESVRKHGVLSALLVRALPVAVWTEAGEITHEAIDGQCRYLAAVAAGLVEVPVNIRAIDDATALELAMAGNHGRNDAPPLDDAEALHRLVTTHGRTVERAAESIGKPVQWVRRRLSLLALGERARALLSADNLPLAHAHLLATVDHATQERALARWDGMGLPSAKVFAREITSALRTLQSAPFDIADGKLPGGSCNGCTRRTDAQADLFGAAPDGARCLGAECWDGKVSAVWERAQKGARRRKGLAVIQDTITLSHDHTCVVRGDVLTARPREGAEVIAIARTAWGKVVELYEPAPVQQPAAVETGAPRKELPTLGDIVASAAQETRKAAEKAAAAEEKRATLARLWEALTDSRTGLASGLRVALLTCARDLDMTKDLRAVMEARGGSPAYIALHKDEELIAAIGADDLAVTLACVLVSAWALDRDAEDGTVMERSMREMLRARETEEPVESIPETAHTGAEVTHALHPVTGAVVTGDDVERIAPVEPGEKAKPGKKARK